MVVVIGNSNLVYTIIRKRHVFHALASLATDSSSINRSLMKKTPLMKKASKGRLDLLKDAPNKERKTSTDSATSSSAESPSMEGSTPALPAEPGTLKVSLASTPGIERMTEKESAHPSTQQLNQLTRGSVNGLVIGPAAAAVTAGGAGDQVKIDETKIVDVCSDTNIAFEADSEVGPLDMSTMASTMQAASVIESTSSPVKQSLPRSASMPLSPRLGQKSRNPSTSSNTSHHAGMQMTRSFSVHSTGVSPTLVFSFLHPVISCHVYFIRITFLDFGISGSLKAFLRILMTGLTSYEQMKEKWMVYYYLPKKIRQRYCS